MPAWQDTLAALYSAVPGPPVSSASAPLVAAGGLVWMPPATPTNDGYMTAAQAASVGGIVTEATVRAALAASAGAVAVHSQKITGLADGTVAGDAVEFSQLAGMVTAANIYSVDVTLTAGTGTVATGKGLTNAVLVGVRLKTPTTSVGIPVATFSTIGVVTVDSYHDIGAGLGQNTNDASTYTVVFAGAI